MNGRSLCLLLVCVAAATAYKSYHGYQLLSFPVESVEQAETIYSMTAESTHFDIWRDAKRPGDFIDILVDPVVLTGFKDMLKTKSITYIVKDADIGPAVDAQMQVTNRNRKATDYTDYLDLAGIETWIDEMVTNFTSTPNQATAFVAGSSYEGRTIRGVKMSTGGTGKPAIWIDSCIHSREWIACASNTYMMQKLMEQYAVDTNVQNYLNAIDVYAVPVFNVDGYAFTHDPQGDRLWRKTRSDNVGSACVGTDPNRNWDFFHCQRGSSTNPCSDTYCGASPFSEIEVDTVKDYVASIPNLQMYVAMHCYGNWWMSCWAHYVDPPPDHAQSMAVCNDVVTAIQSVNGEVFDCGTISSFVGTTSGSSVDWTKDVLGIKYNYAPELRGNGFVLPPDQIIPAGEEAYAGLLELLRNVYEEIP